MTTGAQALVDCLLRERIDHVFGIRGTMNLPILDVLRETAADPIHTHAPRAGRRVHGVWIRPLAEPPSRRDGDRRARRHEPRYEARRRLQGLRASDQHQRRAGCGDDRVQSRSNEKARPRKRTGLFCF
jgi:hypothetical protein